MTISAILDTFDKCLAKVPSIEIKGKNWVVADGIECQPGLFYLDGQLDARYMHGGILRIGQDSSGVSGIYLRKYSVPDRNRLKKLGVFSPNPILCELHEFGFSNKYKPASAVFTKVKNNLVPACGIARAIALSSEIDALKLGAKLVCGTAYVAEYQFHCTFNYKGLSLAFFLEPEAICKIFKDRESEPGERKKALIHIVGKHKRRVPSREEFIQISSYLRGQSNCRWAGMDVSLHGPKVCDYEAFLALVEECERSEKDQSAQGIEQGYIQGGSSDGQAETSL